MIALRLSLVGTVPTAILANQQAPAPTFSGSVQAIFKAKCLQCHSGPTADGKLSLDSFANVMKGGTSGKMIVSKNPDSSLLMQRILGKGGLPRMPMGFAPLPEKDVQTIRAWIAAGSPEGERVRKAHWAYVTPVKPQLPYASSRWAKNEIDLFVLERLLDAKINPSPEADRTTLIRRLSLDLTGLPPTPQEVDNFNNDHHPDAYGQVVERLLASPHFGERMALPWLDAARYADSNGFQMDGDTYQYVWRDWVIKAFNDNMSFDQFTIKQLAGDLLPHPTQDDLVATGFNRNHMLNGEGGAIPEEQRNVGVFDRVETTSTTWLGLTMTCDRCHDHKYDPFKQKDYFSMMALFNNVPESGVPSDNDGKHYTAKPWIYAGSTVEMTKLKSLTSDLESAKKAAEPLENDPESYSKWIQSGPKTGNKDIDAILALEEGKRNQNQKNQLRNFYLDNALVGAAADARKKWKGIDKELLDLKRKLPQVMVMSDAMPRKTFIYSRGDYTSPLTEVKPDSPDSLPKLSQPIKNRLDFAQWIVSPQNPLAARVAVNRIWQTLFGRGLVRTPENFGVQGETPTNPELLDWLSVDFREHGWNVKRLVKQIVTSATYRQSSKVSPKLRASDPDNRLLARGARFRLPSLLIRDQALAASGLLNARMFGKPVYPYQPQGIWDGLNITDERDFSYPQSKGEDLYRRSIYTFWRRTVSPGDMFDTSSRQICSVRQSYTSTPLHALTTLNSVTWVEAARALAQNTYRVSTSPEARLKEAFRRVCARRPMPDELKVLLRSLDRAKKFYESNPKQAEEFLKQGESSRDASIPASELAAYASVCLAIFNLDEALTRE